MLLMIGKVQFDNTPRQIMTKDQNLPVKNTLALKNQGLMPFSHT
ncbi:hypothetical protein [Pseudochrobactrum sp. MP213Fo]